MTDEELDEIEARAAAAIPGPWAVDPETGAIWKDSVSILAATGGHVAHLTRGYESDDDGASPSFKTGRFIAAARSDVPKLVSEVRRLRKALTGVQS